MQMSMRILLLGRASKTERYVDDQKQELGLASRCDEDCDPYFLEILVSSRQSAYRHAVVPLLFRNRIVDGRG